MSRYVLLCVVLSLSLAAPASAGTGKPIRLKGNWYRGPARASRDTIFVASYDNAKSNDADHARGMTSAGGFGMDPTVPGRFGLATRVTETGAHLHYRGGGNFNPDRGTIRLFVRGSLWRDKTPRWLFEARGKSFIGLRRTPTALSLVIRTGRSAKTPVSELDLPIRDVSTDKWHSVVASWDRRTGTGLVALDGRGVRGKIKFPKEESAVFVFYVGGGWSAKSGGGMNLKGQDFDEVAIYRVPVSVLEAPRPKLPAAHEALLPKCEAAARKYLDGLCRLQRWGGWQVLYTSPTLLGSYAQGRAFVDFDTAVSNDKSHVTPRLACLLLYGYQSLGDYHYFEAALRTGEFILAAQDKRGFWSPNYRMTVHGIQPSHPDTMIKLQDSNISHPIFFLSAMYRFTGDKRYLDALKRAGEFYLRAQNPNGSWSHHWNARKKIGETSRRKPQGGELNDLAMNDAIDVMILMYHITGDRKYVEAIRRAGEWLIASQLKGKVCGWADQYDKDNNPAWARNFEPPALSMAGSSHACRALVTLYRLSGDKRYLAPIGRHREWVRRTAGKVGIYHSYDAKTGKPIAAWRYKIYDLTDPKALAWLRTQPTGAGYLRRRPLPARFDQYFERAKAPDRRSEAVVLTPKKARASLDGLTKWAKHGMATQHACGFWVRPKVANFPASIGRGFSAFSFRARPMLEYIEAARVAKGELPPAYRGRGYMLRMAWPRGDWYDVGWEKK